ncbi:DNA-3-methyladenine glycosylase I [Robiginitomaculum antarcticum]|uniref:DNA-3-methyladenine glycosylase I n=1 Tax=Robiginitomaculum antarcticum TaxID=437507 RepID=UPI00037A4EAC|nr:DNA-3-methyladenine glycosylase I [Robiginitomaculum antarcticum]
MERNKLWTHRPDTPRCAWVPSADALYCQYHDLEWGVPVRDSKALFSKLIQDGMQAGLAWITILRKRENILAAFDGLDPDIIAHYDEAKFDALMQDAGIIRSKLKIKAAITNAQIYRKMRDEEGLDFSAYLWSFVGGEPIVNSWDAFGDAPVKSLESEALSKDLKKRGFKFVGPVIVYAFMQAVGMINDHEVSCTARGGAYHG